MNTMHSNKLKYIDIIVLFSFFMVLFWFIMKYIPTDMPIHINSIIKVNSGESSYLPHFLFFFIVNLLSFFSSNVDLMYVSTALVLSLATVGKFLLSKNMILEIAAGSKLENKETIVKIISFALLFCFAIPDIYNFFVLKLMYLGRTPSVVWHNSTIISVFPFAILLFWRQLKLFKKDCHSLLDREIWLVTALIILNILIKPSFIFAFIPISAFFILKDFDKNNIKNSIFKILPIFIGGVCILVQYLSIYYFQTGSLHASKSGITIAMPFEFLRAFIPSWYIPFAFLLSFAFPIATMYYYREIIKFKPFNYALYLTIFGIILSAFVVEDGPRRFHGNFTWQNIICSYLLFLTTTAFLFSKFKIENVLSKKSIILWSLFILHFLSGVLYLFKMYFTGRYH
ncbi:hypothetical protein [uncultured Aquimarina sp.]|uniref:hypothetical protein n=1 Tax=uncultured Aquimarina sp. TaxID=575652 RepID=UPI002618FABC|nr:hypothetical protein [uncultured Aquimarina sp.]